MRRIFRHAESGRVATGRGACRGGPAALVTRLWTARELRLDDAAGAGALDGGARR